MRVARRVLAILFILSLTISAPAFAFKLPSSFQFTEDVPKGSVKGVVIAETANFYATTGTVTTRGPIGVGTVAAALKDCASI